MLNKKRATANSKPLKKIQLILASFKVNYKDFIYESLELVAFLVTVSIIIALCYYAYQLGNLLGGM